MAFNGLPSPNSSDEIISGKTTIFEIQKLGTSVLGFKLLVKCIQATYLGVLNHILEDQYRVCLWLEKVSIPSLGSKVVGLRKLYYPDILSIEIVGIDKESRSRLLKEINDGKRVAKFTLLKSLAHETEDELQSDENDESAECPKEHNSFLTEVAEIEARLPKYRNTPRPTTVKILDELGVDFDEAVGDMANELVISLCAQGINLGRMGRLVWLGIATSRFIYLIDVAKLTPEICLSTPLLDILNDVNKVKVINDSRRLQDYLHHRHKINLCNVFDIQASLIYMHIQSNEDVPSVIRSLQSVLCEYFGIPHSLLRKIFPQMEEGALVMERPLCHSLQHVMAFEVMLLRELRAAMLDVMQKNLHQITAIFVNDVRSKDAIFLQQLDYDIVPVKLQQYDKPIINGPDIKYCSRKDDAR